MCIKGDKEGREFSVKGLGEEFLEGGEHGLAAGGGVGEGGGAVGEDGFAVELHFGFGAGGTDGEFGAIFEEELDDVGDGEGDG